MQTDGVAELQLEVEKCAWTVQESAAGSRKNTVSILQMRKIKIGVSTVMTVKKYII